MKNLKVGCFIIGSFLGIVVIYFLIMFFTWVDFYDLSDEDAKDIVNDMDFKEAEDYLLNNRQITLIQYQGNYETTSRNIWQVNGYLIDFDSIKTQPVRIDLNIKKLGPILNGLKKFKFKYVMVDSLQIDFRLRFSSPISEGFGILTSVSGANLHLDNSEFEEYSKLDNRHYKYHEFLN